jgi:putative oxygen-independent coproporphyrinogen III oxidase
MRPARLADAFGLYVHVPYCRRICPYCDFNVHVAKRADWPALAAGLHAELATRAPAFEARTMDSVYFGGGTPSLAPVTLLAGLLAAATARWPLAADAELTLEADPATLDAEGFGALRRLGITRLSLGWQSTHDHLLRLLGRGHTAAQSEEAYHLARAAGFENVSVDLIFAVPGQTMALLDADIDALLRIEPDHVSLYALTYHEGTELFRRRAAGRVVPVDEDLEADMMAHLEQRLQQAGFEHYEVSNYARPGKRSRHNQLYWHGGRYLGLGPGAHSFVREGWSRGWRWETVRNPAAHAAAFGPTPAAPGAVTPRSGIPERVDPSVSFVEALGPTELASERFLLGLRLADGLELAPLSGLEPARIASAVEEAMRRGWATHDGATLRPTSAGLMNADALAALFF